MIRINGWACFFLVALRLTIGWHFLVEGAYKIRTHQIGKTSFNNPWSGEGFFREGIGPVADWYRQTLGISDTATLSRLRDRAGPWPAVVGHEWIDFLHRFTSHYELTDQQRYDVQVAFTPHRIAITEWLEGDAAAAVSKPVAWGTAVVPQSAPARLAEYDAKRQEIDDILHSKLPAFNKDVERARLRTLMADKSRILSELVAEIESRTTSMEKAVSEAARLTEEQKTKGPLPELPVPKRPIETLDRMTMWMLAVCGGLLLVGLCTPLASILLAGFLLQVVLIAPALPFAPTPPGVTGHYLYINLYVIELIALLALATLPTGRWFGLDALIPRITARRGSARIDRPEVRVNGSVNY